MYFFIDDGGMGSFTAKLLKIPQPERQNSAEMQQSMSMGQMPPHSMAGDGSGMGGGGNMMMQGGNQGFYGNPMGGIGPMMPGSMMGPGPGPDMMNMGNMGNMGNMQNMQNVMMFGGVSTSVL